MLFYLLHFGTEVVGSLEHSAGRLVHPPHHIYHVGDGVRHGGLKLQPICCAYYWAEHGGLRLHLFLIHLLPGGVTWLYLMVPAGADLMERGDPGPVFGKQN